MTFFVTYHVVARLDGEFDKQLEAHVRCVEPTQPIVNFLNVTEIRSQTMYCLTVLAELVSGLAMIQTSGDLSVCFRKMRSRFTLQRNVNWCQILCTL